MASVDKAKKPRKAVVGLKRGIRLHHDDALSISDFLLIDKWTLHGCLAIGIADFAGHQVFGRLCTGNRLGRSFYEREARECAALLHTANDEEHHRHRRAAEDAELDRVYHDMHDEGYITD